MKNAMSLKGLSEAEMLNELDNFTILKVDGKSSKKMLVSVLLHGDESCGLSVLKHCLSNKPELTCLFLIGNSEAAKQGELFSNRLIDENFNRIWTSEAKTANEKRALEVFDFLSKQKLVGVLDIHSYASQQVKPHCFIDSNCEKTKQIAQKISKNVYQVGVNEKMLIQKFSSLIPAILVECGTHNTAKCSAYALKAYDSFIDAILERGTLKTHKIYSCEVNVKLKPGENIDLADDIEKLNQVDLKTDIAFGTGMINSLIVKKGDYIIDPKRLFYEINGIIYLRQGHMFTLLVNDKTILTESGFYVYQW